MPYTITEPHPTVAQNSYTHSGRGGLGNFFRAPATTAPSGVPTPATTSIASSSTSTRRFYSGRGGAGNAHLTAERPVISFDEEFTRAEVREKSATISHVGRGGAGNIFSILGGSSSSKSGSGSGSGSVAGDDGESLTRRDSASTTGSQSSVRSTSRQLWGRISARH